MKSTRSFIKFAALCAGISFVLGTLPSAAQQSNRRLPPATAKGAPTAAQNRQVIGEGQELQEALRFAKEGNYAESSYRLFQLSLSPRFLEKRMQIRYLLGLMLYQLKMYQLSAFQFISVIRDGNSKYVSQSLEKLSLAANELGDDTLLNYAISRVKAEGFPAVHRDMLFYRIGEFQIHNEQYADAIKSLEQVPNQSVLFDKALYLKGLAYAQANNPETAAKVFNDLAEKRSDKPVADTTRVAALMGKARALYQNKNWDEAIATYREVPRDSEFWHDTLFESSWAMLRSGRFRSALSNFQSLHSPYYEDSYIPESLLLRAIVYLYICKYTEMEKTLTLFNRLYRPVYNTVNQYLSTVTSSGQYFTDVVNTLQMAEKPGFDPSKLKSKMPYLVTRKAIREGDFQRSFNYIKKLVQERRLVRGMSSQWKNAAIGKYALQTLDRRLERARQKAGREVHNHMVEIRSELIDLFEQEGFIRYEMLNSKKEYLKKKVAGKDLPGQQIDDEQSRDYYVQNGYDYYPFRGEYWLDELGNYHYLGTQSCE